MGSEPGGDVVIRARAPLRVSFCGGGTDLLPYVREHGGLVLSATIARHAYASLRVLEEQTLRVRSLDFDTVASFGLDEPLIYDGKLDLVKACLRRLRMGSRVAACGLELYLETDAPPGSGLGSSSALVVAVIGAFTTWQHVDRDRYEIAGLAYDLERKDVGIAGGLQDQYSATFGGLNLIEFRDEHDVVVNPLRIDPYLLHELEYNSLLAFTGATRMSNRIIESQVVEFETGNPQVLAALHRMKELARHAKDALLRGRVVEFGEILHDDWMQKRRTSRAITNDHIDHLYAEARRLGAIGGKVSGAGGGGFMFIVCPFDRKPEVIRRLDELGATVAPVRFEPDGLQTWSGPAMTQRHAVEVA